MESPVAPPPSSSPPSSPLLSPGCLGSTLLGLASAGVSIWVIRGLFDVFPAVLETKDRWLLAGWALSLAVAVSPASALPLIGRVAARFLPGGGGK